MAEVADFEVLGEVREPPARSREGRYGVVRAALNTAKKEQAGEWVALVQADKKTIAAVRNAASLEFQSDLAWRSSIHPDEDDPEIFTLFVKYDKADPRAPRKRKVSTATPQAAAPAAEPETPAEPAADGEGDGWGE